MRVSQCSSLRCRPRARFGLRVGPLRICNAIPRRDSSQLSRERSDDVQLDLPALDIKWRTSWKRQAISEKPATRSLKENNINHGDRVDSTKKDMYVLPMFPYPSGKLHLGHLRVYTIADVVARFRRMQGHNVLLPMGWDAFGLPAENAAIEHGVDPTTWTKQNIARMKEQLELMNGSFDWSREFATCDPDFYKQTQRIFLLLLKNGLVSQKLAQVNWDPVDKTVLANEQVDAAGNSWRSGAKIEIRNLKQWFFNITQFQDSLLRGLENLAKNDAWPERVLSQQKNWLGRTEGAHYDFLVKSRTGPVLRAKVYTSRPETVFAAQFLALSPQSPIVQQLAQDDAALASFLQDAKDLPHTSMEGYRIPYLTATSPVNSSSDAKRPSSSVGIPVYVAPYVRGDYETGALMGVPAHDLRDFTFWNRHQPNQPIKYAVSPVQNGSTKGMSEPFLNAGYMTSLAQSYQRVPSEEAAKLVVKQIAQESGLAKPIVKWKLRDWLISRQRYWGTPIPIIHCHSCGPQPVPDDQLPVTLPTVDHHWAGGKTGNPLESATDWINTTCPKCHGPGKRDTDTMDTFVDSSWYYMRFADPGNPDLPVSESALINNLPVDMYIGGVEHAILHLLYARFIYKAVIGILYPQRVIAHELDEARTDLQTRNNVEKMASSIEGLMELLSRSSIEPFKQLITQGMVHGKTYTDPSTGRVLRPDEIDFSVASKPRVVATGQMPTVTFEKMSKSKHNGVDPTTFISQHGADATRAHMLFQAPVDDVVNWDEHKIAGITRWLNRLHRTVSTLAATPRTSNWNSKDHFSRYIDEVDPKNKQAVAERNADAYVWQVTQKGIIAVSQAYEKVYVLNKVVSHLMEWTNSLHRQPASDVVKAESVSRLLRLMAPITPAFAEECWSILHPSSNSIFDLVSGGWPEPDGTLEMISNNSIDCAVQVNGKLRCVVPVVNPPEELEQRSPEFKDWFVAGVLASQKAQAKLMSEECDIRKAKAVFVVKGGKTVNFVI